MDPKNNNTGADFEQDVNDLYGGNEGSGVEPEPELENDEDDVEPEDDSE